MENIILVSIITFISGIFIGAIGNHFFRYETTKNRRLEQQLDELQRKNTQYQAEVSSHFSQTATILNRLNEDFHEIQSHLMKAAGDLCSDAEAEHFQPLPDPNKKEVKEKEAIEVDTAPLDYAPKSKDKEESTLKEGYGLKH